GEPDGTRLQVAGTSLGVEIDSQAGQLELRVTFELVGLALVLSAGDQDSFLAQLLGGDLTVPLPLPVAWASRTGLSFSGSAGLALSACPHVSVGPTRIGELARAVRSVVQDGRPPELDVSAGLGLGGALGPVEFTVEDIGLGLRLSFTEGNAGPFDLGVGFKPPVGVGLAVEAGPGLGGGVPYYHPATGGGAGGVPRGVSGGSREA